MTPAQRSEIISAVKKTLDEEITKAFPDITPTQRLDHTEEILFDMYREAEQALLDYEDIEL